MTGPTKTAALAPMHGGEPYSQEGQRLAPHPARVNELEQARKTELGKFLLSNQSEFFAIAKAAQIPAERLVLELMSVARKKPEIMKCTEASIMTFMLDAAKLGLTIGRGVFPVPVNHGKGRDQEKRLEAWVGYKGSKELAMGSGAIRDCFAFVVFEGDDYVFEKAPVPRVVRHKDGPHTGDMRFALKVYATLLFPFGQTRSLELSKEKVEELRKKNRGDTTAGSSPWVTSTEDMWKAKALLQITKDLPQTPRLKAMHEVMERQGEMDPAREVQPAPDTAALPAGSPAEAEPGFEDPPVDEPKVMSYGEAEVVLVTLTGGAKRMLREFRSERLEELRTWARKKLDEEPENGSLQRIAEGATVVLDARAAGTAKEPPKKAAA